MRRAARPRRQDEEPDKRARRRKLPVVWQLIQDNIYMHRRRKKQDEDEIMICQCRFPTDGAPACGEHCLNRLLNIECVPVRVVRGC